MFEKLFSRKITFGDTIINFVSVLDSDKRGQNDDLFCGLIKVVDFNKREVVIKNSFSNAEKTIPFDKIVTLSRMKDGRLRMWINTKGSRV